MQKFWSIFSIFVLVFSLSIDTADARRFGGGKSFGKTHKTQPAAKRKAAPVNQQQQQTSPQQNTPAGAAAPAASKGGMFGGLMGGLLAGGLFAYLLGSGAFEGLEFGDIIIFALLAFGAIYLFRRLKGANQPASSAANSSPFSAKPSQTEVSQNSAFMNSQAAATASQGASRPGFKAVSDVPLNLPAGFNEQEFLATGVSHYYTLQEAWNTANFGIIEDYLAPGLLKNLQLEREELPAKLDNQVANVAAEIVRADQSATVAEISLNFSGSYKDELNGETGTLNDTWHLERDLTQANQPWLIVGIESA